MRATIFCERSVFLLTSVFVGLSLAAPADALVCLNDPTRTLFAGGPGTDACRQFTDEATCNTAFHRSGAGPLAPCRWTISECVGNTTKRLGVTAPNSCEPLPAQRCVDPTRTIKLTGGTIGDSGTEVCRTLTDQATCEMAWHTTAKGVGMSCCWNGSGCKGSAGDGGIDSCSIHGNTCFAELTAAPAAAAPAASGRALFALGATLLCIGAVKLRVIRHPRS